MGCEVKDVGKWKDERKREVEPKRYKIPICMVYYKSSHTHKSKRQCDKASIRILP